MLGHEIGQQRPDTGRRKQIHRSAERSACCVPDESHRRDWLEAQLRRRAKTMDKANRGRGKRLILSVAALVSAAALSLAAPASADQADDAFVAALKQHGIVFANRDAAIATSHSVCAGLDKGQSPTVVVLSLVKNTDLSPHQAGYFLGASVASHCPQYRSDIGNSASSSPGARVDAHRITAL